MVKRQRRMTVKKNSKKPNARTTVRAKASTSKVKRPGRPKGKPKPAQTDRANQAMKTLAKRLQKMEDRE
jgi:hypothetical protein